MPEAEEEEHHPGHHQICKIMCDGDLFPIAKTS
jgi:hypothetical protein